MSLLCDFPSHRRILLMTRDCRVEKKAGALERVAPESPKGLWPSSGVSFLGLNCTQPALDVKRLSRWWRSAASSAPLDWPSAHSGRPVRTPAKKHTSSSLDVLEATDYFLNGLKYITVKSPIWDGCSFTRISYTYDWMHSVPPLIHRLSWQYIIFHAF